MSRHTAMVVLDQIIGKPSLILPSFVIPRKSEVTSDHQYTGLMAAINALAEADIDREKVLSDQRAQVMIAAYFPNNSPAPQSKPFAFAEGKAIIPIHGVLLNRLPYSFGFATGYSFIRSQLDAAMADPDVNGIIYDVDSLGGLVSGCEETSDMIFNANGGSGGKPSIAVVDSNCYSGAYMLASAADKVVSTPSGGAGSIGVVMAHADMSKMLASDGVKVTFIYAGDHKVDGNHYEPLSKEVTSDLQSKVDKIYDRFVGTVARNRPGMTDQAVRDTEARCYQADEALQIGLIDAIQSPPAAIRQFVSDQNEDPFEQKGPDMTEKTAVQTWTAQPPAVQQQPTPTGPSPEQIAADARTTERQRISAIQTHAEAEGRTELANHLALNTDMDVEAAAGILKSSPKAAPPAAPAVKTEEGSHFKNAMNQGKHPNVGGNSEDNGNMKVDADGNPLPVSAAQRILAAQKRVTGVGGAQGEAEKLRRVV